jgi:hypothetical protein
MELFWIAICLLFWSREDTYAAMVGLVLGLVWKTYMY